MGSGEIMNQYNGQKPDRWIRPMLLAVGLFFVCLTGCEKNQAYQMEPVNKTQYQKAGYQTAKVKRGDISPIVQLKLRARLADQVKYSIDITDAEVEEVYVSAGEHVKKGQLLVSFQSEKTQKAID